MPNRSRRLGPLAAFALGLTPFLYALADGPPPPIRTQHYQGKVVPLADRLKAIGSRLDPDAAPHWLALVTDDGKVYPLIKDDGSRGFFKDERLRQRPMRLTGRLFADTHLLQVMEIHSLPQGVLHEVYYWCEVCAIRRNEKDICECCGGPMELREVPLRQ